MNAVRVATFASLLRSYRKAAGLTQEELAAAAGLSARAVSDLERGLRVSPHKDTMRLLAEALRLTDAERMDLAAAARSGRRSTQQLAATQSGSQAPAMAPVGRQREIEQIERLLSGQGPPVLLLSGEPGIGKTCLLREAMRRATDAGWRVIEGGCQRHSGHEPYEPFVSAISRFLAACAAADRRRHLQGCAWLIRLLPELAEAVVVTAPARQLPPHQERRLIFAAVARLLANLAGPAGALLVLDDLQWASPDAVDLLATLARMMDGSLRVLGAYRSTEARLPDPLIITLTDLTHEELATQMEVGPLDHAEAAQLLDIIAEDTIPIELAEQALRRSGGVPFFLISCVRALRAGAQGGPDRARVAPWDVAQSVRQRVAAMSQTAQQLLEMAAVFGHVVSFEALVAMLAWSDDDALAALDELSQARLLVTDGAADTYQFAHDLIREVVEDGLSPARRKIWHRRVAEALERMPGGSSPALLADHFERGGAREKAIQYLELTADAAFHVGAFADVRSALRRATALAPESEQLRLYELLGDRMLGARGDDAEQAYQSAVDLWRTWSPRNQVTGARLLRKLMILYFRWPAGLTTKPSDDIQERLTSEALRLAEEAGDEDELRRARVATFFWRARCEDVGEQEAREAEAETLEIADYFQAREDWSGFHEALDAHTVMAMAIGAHEDALAASQRRLDAPALSLIDRCDALNMVATCSFSLGLYDRCIATMREAIAQLQTDIPLDWLSQGLNCAAQSAWFSGRWTELHSLAQSLVEASPPLVIDCHWMELLLMLAREDQAAAAHAASLVEQASSGRPQHIRNCERALLAAYHHDDPDALDLDAAEYLDTCDYAYWALAFLSEHGVQAPEPFLAFARVRRRGIELHLRITAIAQALAIGDDVRLAQAVEDAEAHGLIPHAARMRFVLAQRTGDRGQLARARPALEQLGDLQFLRRLDALAAIL